MTPAPSWADVDSPLVSCGRRWRFRGLTCSVSPGFFASGPVVPDRGWIARYLGGEDMEEGDSSGGSAKKGAEGSCS